MTFYKNFIIQTDFVVLETTATIVFVVIVVSLVDFLNREKHTNKHQTETSSQESFHQRQL